MSQSNLSSHHFFSIVMFVLYVRVRRYTLTVDDRREMGGDEASHTYIHQLTIYENI